MLPASHAVEAVCDQIIAFGPPQLMLKCGSPSTHQLSPQLKTISFIRPREFIFLISFGRNSFFCSFFVSSLLIIPPTIVFDAHAEIEDVFKMRGGSRMNLFHRNSSNRL